MTINCAITKLYLNNFRNYQHLDLNLEPKSVIIKGVNGAGKTSLLESISMLVPGRGLKDSINNDLKYMHQSLWTVLVKLKFFDEEIKIAAGLQVTNLEKEKKIIKINDEVVKSLAESTKYLSLLWLTPQLEQSLVNGRKNRRKFIDRMVYNFNYQHAELVLSYEKIIKERLSILKNNNNYDTKWLDIIEEKAASIILQINQNRQQIIDMVNKEQFSLSDNFPKLDLAIECKSLNLNQDQIVKKFVEKRQLDQITGRSNFGCHKSNLIIKNLNNGLMIEHCSTGEQKSLLIALILMQAYAQKRYKGYAPIMLLDEIMVHLDQHRQCELLKSLSNLNSQIWITDIDNKFWPNIQMASQYFTIKNAGIFLENIVS